MKDSECVECGAPLVNGAECRDYLHEMVKWDFEDFAGVGRIHHLTVLSYNLQHPSMYSSKGLEDAKYALEDFLTNPDDFFEHDKKNRERLASDVRDWKITGTPEDHGSYTPVPAWKMVASDVVRGGLPSYVDNVTQWAQSILSSLKESENYT